MNTWQLLQQIRYLGIAQTWTGSNTIVFPTGSVIITQTNPQEMLSDIRPPALFIGIGSEVSDPAHDEEPDLLRQEIVAALLVEVPGPAGEFNGASLIGRCRAGQAESGGRGLLEVEEELFNAIELVGPTSGVRIICRAKSAPEPQTDDTFKHIMWRGYRFEAMTSADRYYQQATNLSLSEAGGTVTATWTLPPDRYDRNEVVLRYASGATAPADQTSGTGVTLASALATSGTVALVAGTYSFALFSGYDEDGDGTTDRWSSGTTATITFT